MCDLAKSAQEPEHLISTLAIKTPSVHSTSRNSGLPWSILSATFLSLEHCLCAMQWATPILWRSQRPPRRIAGLKTPRPLCS